jgi:hypothetical protein
MQAWLRAFEYRRSSMKAGYVIGMVITVIAGVLMGQGVAYQHAESCSGSLGYVISNCFSDIRQFTFTIGIVVGIPGWYLLHSGGAILGATALGFGIGYAAGGHRYSALIGGLLALAGAAATFRSVSAQAAGTA